MLNKDIDWEDDLGKLRSGKRYNLEGRKRNDDGKCKRYIEEGQNAVSQSDSEDDNDRVKRPETPKNLLPLR